MNQTALALDHSPLILRDVGAQEIYALDWQAPPERLPVLTQQKNASPMARD